MDSVVLERSAIASGQEPLPPRRAPVYGRHVSDVESNGNDTARAVHTIWSRWREGRYHDLTDELVRVGDLIQSKDEVRFTAEFLAFGGIDVYCFILCDPLTPAHFLKDRLVEHQHSSAMAERRRQRSIETLLSIYSEIMLQLTDLLANQNDLGWVLYDRCPGLFYRLIEFLEDSTLWSSATGLLEHALSCVGPVIEISKTPSLVRVLRNASPSALAAFCRFLALLILPGLTQGQNPIVARRLHYPESVAVLRQVQRVVDSNVLWLIGEEGLVNSLLVLCELRPNGLRVQQGGRSMMMMPPGPYGTAGAVDPRDGALLDGSGAGGALAGQQGAAFLASDEEWEDDEEDEEGEEGDEEWADAEEPEGSAASGASDGTADFLVDGSSLPTFFAGIERLLGIGQSATNTATNTAAAASPASSPAQPQRPGMGATAAGSINNSSNTAPSSRGGFASAALPAALPAAAAASFVGGLPPGGAGPTTQGELLEYVRSVVRANAALNPTGAGATAGVTAAAGTAADAPGAPPGPADAASLAELARFLGAINATPEVADQIDLLNRMSANQLQAEDPSRLVQWMLDRNLIEEDGMDQNFKSTMEIQWWVGAVDTRQRWRLCDPSLLPERDDNRWQVVTGATRRMWTRGMQQVSRAEFASANERLNRQLFEPLPQVESIADLDVYGVQRIVESQSEVLFLLNMLLSTFYFSDAWRLLRDCQWLPRSVPMMEAAFGLDPRLPALVDVPPHVNLSEEMRSLPRFLPPRSRDDHDVFEMASAMFYPEHWRILPFLELLGGSASTYLRDPNQMVEEEPDNHQHGPDTMRKMELLRGLYEFWNAQDRTEQAMVVEDPVVVASARLDAEAMAAVICRDREDSCVRIGLYQTLESYLRTFLYGTANRDAADSPQTQLGAVLLPAMLERVYNGTRIPGLNGSMVPSKLQSNMFTLLGELVRYHGGNLRTLCSYVTGECNLSHLNAALSNANRQNPVILSTIHAEVEEVLKKPPLEREEHEPFGSVLLRRLLSYGGDTHLFLRALLLSLTPGLRSRGNYLDKPVPDTVEDVRLPAALPGIGRTSDIISGDAVRIAYVIRVSRQFAREISLAPREGGRRTELLQELVEVLARTPHRQQPEQRPFPSLFCEAGDVALLQRGCPLPPVGPPRRLRLPLFYHPELPDPAATTNDGAGDAGLDDLQRWLMADAAVLSGVTPLAQLLLGEPHKLVFSALCGLNIEAMEDNTRLSVVTTVLLVFLRVAMVGGVVPSAPPTRSADGVLNYSASAEAHVRGVLDNMRRFAKHGYDTWLAKEKEYRARQAEKRRAAAVLAAAREGRHFRSLQEDDGVCVCDWRDTATREEAVADRKRRGKAGGSGAAAGVHDEGDGEGREGEANAAHNLPAALGVPRRASDYDTIDFGVSPVVSRGVPEPDALRWRCPGLMRYGSCDPPHEGSVYQREFGGCFYRSFFRLLCLWIGYYASCQRYVATVFFSTEVAFGEYKTMALFLLRILPDYFMPRYSEAMASSTR